MILGLGLFSGVSKMSPQWITALVAIAGLVGNACWSAINLRIENRMFKKVDELKEWAESRFVLRLECPCAPPAAPRPNGQVVPHGRTRPHGQTE